MKKIIYLFASAMLLTFNSCNDDADIITPLENESEFEKFDGDAIIIDSEEKLMSMFPEVEPSNIELLENLGISTRGFQSLTVYGYTSYTSNGVQKAAFNATNAAIFGLSAGTYMVEFFVVKRTVTVPSGYYPVIMTGNGWNPDGTNQELGYTASLIGNQFTMSTKVTCIRYNMAGQTLNIWKPTTLSSLTWTYGLAN